ncbi:hypothetical protein FN846DRAFT_509391 [Sphaerosporella brunnea]|uniref:Uncharacterized protein n=1 Tax=Sphaerosporella brunnea TaxID=1250544 RepID=A0A5J5F4B3_9PEZI|nr:hypothetical protein FN846DRAFT_509391 [Sphaerosporella brunnea]
MHNHNRLSRAAAKKERKKVKLRPAPDVIDVTCWLVVAGINATRITTTTTTTTTTITMPLLSLPPELLLQIIALSPSLSAYLSLHDTCRTLRDFCRAAYPSGKGLAQLLRRERAADAHLDILCAIDFLPKLGDEQLRELSLGQWERMKRHRPRSRRYVFTWRTWGMEGRRTAETTMPLCQFRLRG